MIRVLIDELGAGHGDLILKIDAMPAFAHFGSSYYMSDFLCLDPDTIKRGPEDLAIAYIKYVKDRIDDIGSSEVFILFDIQDEYVGGLLLSKKEKGLIQTSYGATRDIHGHEVSKDLLDRLIAERSPKFERQGHWILSEDSITKGLDWSIERIRDLQSRGGSG